MSERLGSVAYDRDPRNFMTGTALAVGFDVTEQPDRGPARSRSSRYCPLGLGIDQYARIEHAMRIQGLLGGPEGRGKQWWALAIVPRPMVAPDRMMVSDRATVRDHGI